MTKLLLKNVYLAGAITDCPDPVSWRLQAKALLPPGWYALDPMEYDTTGIAEDTIKIDLRLIDRSRAIVVRADIPSWGAGMELFYAKKKKIPVYAFAAPKHRSLWLTAHVTTFYDTLEQAMNRLNTRVRLRRIKDDAGLNPQIA